MNPQFWHGRRVFLTGHTGFKGSWLSLWLQQLGASVFGYALAPPTRPSLFEVGRVDAGMNSVLGDIREPKALQQAMRAAAPEVVIHMAAQPLVRRSYVDPVETYSTNVMGTVHLLEAVRECATVRAVLNVTTDKCYDNREWLWGYRENEPLGGKDPYSSSKACAELVTAAYRSSYFNQVQHNGRGVVIATARAGNVIGGGDWAEDRLVPDVLRAFERGQAVCIRNPHAVRPWQHVLEPLRGYLSLAERLVTDGSPFADAWNFGPADQDAKPVSWIVDRLAQQWGRGAQWQMDDDAKHPHEATYLKLDSAKAAAGLGWRPILGLDGALDMIMDWTAAHASGADMRSKTLAQIAGYQQRVVDARQH